MITTDEVLERLDNFRLGYYCLFVDLGHVYSYLIDSRLNVFRDDNNRWAIAVERLGYNPRAGTMMVDIYYFGNCLTNLENYNNQDINYYSIYPVLRESINSTTDGERLREDAKSWTIRDKQVSLSQNLKDYLDAGIELREYKPGEIAIEEVGRLLITTHQDLFRATDAELYKSIPKELKKILVLNEWYHRDFTEISAPIVSEEHLKATYELNKNFMPGNHLSDYETFAALFRQQEETYNEFNMAQWNDNRPSSYETWQLIAKVIATNDPSQYQPTLMPNTHWHNWPDSGSM